LRGVGVVGGFIGGGAKRRGAVFGAEEGAVVVENEAAGRGVEGTFFEIEEVWAGLVGAGVFLAGVAEVIGDVFGREGAGGFEEESSVFEQEGVELSAAGFGESALGA
jgi:hypothetical protein